MRKLRIFYHTVGVIGYFCKIQKAKTKKLYSYGKSEMRKSIFFFLIDYFFTSAKKLNPNKKYQQIVEKSTRNVNIKEPNH